MAPLHKLWPALDDIPGAQASLAEWRTRLGDAFPSVQPFLRPTDQFTASLPVDGEPYASYRVVRHAADDIVGVHDGGGPTITLSKLDVLIYRLDHERVIRDTAAALGLEAAHEVVDGLSHTHRIGTFRPFAGFAFPCFLTLPVESDDLQRAAELIAVHNDVPFILMAPTNSHLRPACESLLRHRRACFLTLSDAVAVDDQGKWTASAAAKDRLTAFQQATIPQATDETSIAFFPTPPNATWGDLRIKFDDGESVTVKVGDARGRFLYSQMGMVDGRSTKPNTRWRLLQSFAKGYGVLTWDSPDASSKNQKRRETLSRDLQAFFRIEGDPIEYVHETKGWRTLFTLEPDA